MDSPIWTSSDPLDPVKQLASANRWLKNCQENHEACNALEASLNASCPTRLIDISRSTLLLVCPPAASTVAYAALSHCWGGGLPIKTTLNNFQEHLVAIQMDALPRTYRDAVTVSRELGIQYLWIDSLCIIQDDPRDWEREAARMASVYEGAVVTIVASWGNNGDSGCFHPPKPSMAIEARGQNSLNGDDHISTTRLYLRPKPDPARYLGNSHLSTRAWAFQEVILSRRVVVFTDEQLYWQCTSVLESEDGLESSNHLLGIRDSLPSLGVAIRQPDIPLYELYHSWEVATQRYSKRFLIYPSDKFAALAGIVQMFQRATGDIPLAGLWKSNICKDLLWNIPTSTHGKLDTEAIGALNIPSWSWAKLHCQVESQADGNEPCVKITDASVTWSGVPLISKIQHASISGLGKLVKLVEFHAQDRVGQCICKASLFVRFENSFDRSSEYYKVYGHFDECSQEIREPLTCLLLYKDARSFSRYQGGDVLSLSTLFLTAAQDTESKSTYHRVGTGMFYDVPREIFYNCSETEFTLI